MTYKANYSSCGYQVYGDVDRVREDAKTLHEILSRQGTDIFLEVIANHVGRCAFKFNLSQKEIDAAKSSLRLSLDELINERT